MAIVIKFLDVLVLFGQQEEMIEQIRVQLAQNQNFTLYLAYQQLDKENKGGISMNDMLHFIGNCNEDSLKRIINHYNQQPAELLLFPSFISFVLPKNNANLRKIVTERQNKDIEESDFIIIKQLLLQLFENELNLVKSQIKQTSKYQFPIEDIFQNMDSTQKGYIIMQDLYEFTQRFGYSLYQEQLTFIWNRIDTHMKGKVILEDLKQLFTSTQLLTPKDQQPMKETQTLKPIPSDWQTKPNCYYHPMNKYERHFIKDTAQFLENRVKLKKFERSQIQSLLFLFQEQGQINYQIEWFLQKLSLRPDFNLIDCFRLFDIQQQGIIGIQDLKQTFDHILGDFNLEELDLLLMIKYFDKDLDGLVKFSDFAFQLMPKSKKHQEVMKNKEANIIGTDIQFNFKMFTKETQDSIRVFFIKLILLLRLSFELKVKFQNNLILRLIDIIGLIDTDSDKKISQNDIIKTSKKLKFDISFQDLNNFYLGFDFEQKKLTYDEIINFVSIN